MLRPLFHRSLFYLALLLTCGPASAQFNQSDEYRILDTMVIKKLDTCWRIIVRDNTVEFLLKDRVFPMSVINAPYAPANPELLPYTRYVMKLRFDPVWEPKRLDSCEAVNSRLRSEVLKLPRKYHIEKFRDQMNMYQPHNKRQRGRLENYLVELDTLYAKMIVMPVFYTVNYSIFLDENSCYIPNEQHPDWTGFFLYPDSAEMERDGLLKMLDAYLKKVSNPY